MLRYLAYPLSCIVLVAVLAGNASGQQIWSGYGLAFTKPNGANWTLEINQDRITDRTWITRQFQRGVFNIRTEVEYDFVGFSSPENTEWAYDLVLNGNEGQLMAATNFANLTFDTFREAINGFPPGIIGLPGVLHLISEDIYIDIMFTDWGAMEAAGGSFAYLRSTAPEPNTALLLAIGLVGLSSTRSRSVIRSRRSV